MKIGFHLSTKGGAQAIYKEAQRLGCECIQIFVKSPRSWNKKKWNDDDISFFKDKFANIPVFSHLSYLPNLAKGEEKDIKGFFYEIELSLELGIKSIVVHCGSKKEKEEGISSVSRSINFALEKFPIEILVENSSGQGNSIGKDLEEISRIFEKLKDVGRVKLCIDTAHLFQSGVDIRKKTLWDRFLTSVERIFGKDKIGLIHLNDSKTELASRVDRHWHIGYGKLGKETFRYILNDKRLSALCVIMETPQMGKMDKLNMDTVRSLLLPLVSHPFS